LKTANMIRNGTEGALQTRRRCIEALQPRVADIDQYNVKGTTNVFRHRQMGIRRTSRTLRRGIAAGGIDRQR
jgi:hypothetical protein